MSEVAAVSRLSREIGAFLEQLPKGVSKEARDALLAVQKQLDGPKGEAPVSPGQKALQYAQQGTSGTGVHFSKAVQGVDVPSDGQTE